MATTMIGILALIQQVEELKLTTGGWDFIISAWTAIFSPIIF